MRRSLPLAPSNVDVVVAALYLLGGTTKRIHTEDIALMVFDMARAQFSWRKHPEYPDKDIVRVALTDAAKEEHGRLVTGRSGRSTSYKGADGWQLTAAGARWAASNTDMVRDRLGEPTADPQRREIDRVCREIRRSGLFQQWTRGELRSATRYEFTDFLSCSPDAPPSTIVKRFERMHAAAEAARNKEVIAFLEACRTQFKALATD